MSTCLLRDRSGRERPSCARRCLDRRNANNEDFTCTEDRGNGETTANGETVSSDGARGDEPGERGPRSRAGGVGETQWLWCHDCRRHLAAGPDHDPDAPACPSCRGAFVEYAEEYQPPDPARQAEEALRQHMAQIASQFSNIMPGIQVSVEMGADGAQGGQGAAAFGFMGGERQGGFRAPEAFMPMMQQLFQPGGAQVSAARLFEDFLNGIGQDINIAELDTRTYHNPAPPEVVAALPRVPMPAPSE